MPTRGQRRRARAVRVALAVLTGLAGVAGAQAPDAPAPPPSWEEPQPIYFPLKPRRSAHAADREELPEDVLRLFMTYHTSMQYERAAECALRLTAMAPDQALAHYNLACVMARLHRADEALDALEAAVDRGWRNLRHMTIDPDLRLVRGSPRYERLAERLAGLIESERLSPRPLRTDDWVEVVEDLADEIPPLLDRSGVPGMTVALVADGVVVWTAGFGTADRGRDRAMAVDQRFRLRAPQHLFAFVAALQAEHEGRLSLPRLVVAWEEQRALARMSGGDAPGVRLATLDPAGRFDAAAAGSFFQLLLVALETDRSFADQCRDGIFDPLALDDTGLLRGRAPTVERLAVGHSLFGTPVDDSAVGRPGPDLGYTTAADLARVLAGLLAPGTGGLETVGPRPLDRLCGLAASLPSGLDPQLGADVGGDGPRIELTGRLAGSGCLVRGYARSGRGVVVLFNGEQGLEPARRVARIALGGR
jgi:CubicO group peptidase (beta-lactamase class C family)